MEHPAVSQEQNVCLQYPVNYNSQPPQYYSGYQGGLPAQPNILPMAQTGLMGFSLYPNIPQLQQHPANQFLPQPAVGGLPHWQYPYTRTPFDARNIYAFPSLLSPMMLSSANPISPSSELEFSAADEQLLARILRDGKKTKSLAEIFGSLNGSNNHSTEQWTTFYMNNSIKIDELQINAVTSRTSSHAPQSCHRSPSAAGKILHPPKMLGRSRYTEEDKKFFFKTFAHALAENPDMTYAPNSLISKLVEGASHHSGGSWRSWIRDNIREIKYRRRRILEESSSECHSDDESKTNPAEPSSDDESEAEDSEHISITSSESESDIRDRDRKMSRLSRNAYLPGERRALAKFIADITLAKWDAGRNRSTKWKKFQTMQPRHTTNAWREWYRTNKEDVTRQAKRFETRNAMRKQAQGAHRGHRPSSYHGRQDGGPQTTPGSPPNPSPIPNKRRDTPPKQTAKRSKPTPQASMKLSPGPHPVLENPGS